MIHDALFLKRLPWLFLMSMLLCCSPSTEITGSWKNPDYQRASVTKILVTAMSSSTEARQTLERNFALALQQKGYQVEPGTELFGPEVTGATGEGRDTLLARIQDSAIDAILTIALINDQTENRFVPGRYDYDPIQRYEYYRGFWQYFGYRQPTINTPGYYEEDKVYFLEINLYDAQTEELLWSAQSETYSAGDLSSVSKGFTAVVVDKMEEDGVIK